MSDPATPKITFPCDYPVKIVGASTAEFAATVVELTQRHAPEVTDEQVSIRDSRHGNYCAVTITIRATGEVQLRALHETLRSYPPVRMVL